MLFHLKDISECIVQLHRRMDREQTHLMVDLGSPKREIAGPSRSKNSLSVYFLPRIVFNVMDAAHDHECMSRITIFLPALIN